jgi:Protein of unknown function (DUF3626)
MASRGEWDGGSPPTAANRAALAFVRAAAQRDRARHVTRIERLLAAAGIDADIGQLGAGVRAAGRVTMNFHPDRLLADGRSVAEALHQEGVYRSQFESKVSSAGLTAFPGGQRDRWEDALFGGAYQAPGVQGCERPRYGGLNLMSFSNGACPRFGSCHLRLVRDALDRSTFFFGDSVFQPTEGGVIDAFEPVLAAMLESVARHGSALGRPGVTLSELVGRLLDVAHGRGALFAPSASHSLDDYIEAHAHGVVSLRRDVEALVIDPSFRATPTEEMLLATAERYGFPIEWHSGPALRPADVPTEAPAHDEPSRWRSFCADGRAARLAERVVDGYAADGRHVDAAAIGRAAASAVRQPLRWREWGTTAEALTCLKDLWLIVVVYGRPRAGEDP